MPHINLLPWRERQKREREIRFGVAAGTALVLMGLIVFGVHTFMAGRIDYQKRRNAYLTEQIEEKKKKIEEIKELQTRKEKLLARRKVIEQLELDRTKMVHLFDELARRLPEGVYFTSMEQKGSNVKLKGIAQSDARVASLMNNLTASEWFETPNVKQIKSEKNAKNKNQPQRRELSEFEIEVKQIMPKQETDEDDEVGA